MPNCAACNQRPAVCSGIAAAGQEWGSLPLCEECGNKWHGDVEPLDRTCDICTQRPSVNFLMSMEERNVPPWRSGTRNENLSIWAKRLYFCQDCRQDAAAKATRHADNYSRIRNRLYPLLYPMLANGTSPSEFEKALQDAVNQELANEERNKPNQPSSPL